MNTPPWFTKEEHEMYKHMIDAERLAWAKKHMRCETCCWNVGKYSCLDCARGVEEEWGPRPDWGCTLWEPKRC